MGLKQHYVIIIIIIIIINCYYSQARSSVPPKIPLINKFFLFESWVCWQL